MSIYRIFHKQTQSDANLRNFIFGVEDSLVSTVGLLAGVAVAQISHKEVIITGLVLIVVEGLSMGVGSFLTEETTEEMSGYAPQPLKAFKGAIVMLISYSLAGLIPLAPYAFIQDNTAVIVSVIVSLIGLFGLGIGTSIFYHRPRPWVRGLKMVVLGGIAVLFGMLVGNLVHLRVQ